MDKVLPWFRCAVCGNAFKKRGLKGRRPTHCGARCRKRAQRERDRAAA